MRRPSRASLGRAARTTLPFVLTALLGAGLALAFGLMRPAATPITTIVQVIFPTAAATQTPPPPTEVVPPPDPSPIPATATVITLPADTISLQIVTLQQDLRRTVGSLHLLKAASRLQTARFSLRDNDLPEVLRQLTVAQEDLDAATALVRDELKGPIQALLTDINTLRDDVPVRPEIVDRRLADLWETATALADVELPE